jgi:hypothetical protein
MHYLFWTLPRLLLENALLLCNQVNSALTATAEEKYIKLTNGYPDIIARVPQHMIASYLGLTPEIKPGEKTNYPS